MTATAPAADRVAVARVAGRTVVVAGVAVALGLLHLHRPATLCPWRATTGLPCPFCGGTTAAVALGRGHLVSALRASPLAVALLVALPFARAARPPRWWRSSAGLRVVLVSATLGASELWQLARFGLVRT